MKYLLLFTLCINVCFAQDAVPIKKGDKSPISGVVITEDLAKKLDKDARLVIEYKELGRLNKELIERQEDQIKILEQKQSINTFKNIGYFILGVLTTSLVVRTVK